MLANISFPFLDASYSHQELQIKLKTAVWRDALEIFRFSNIFVFFNCISQVHCFDSVVITFMLTLVPSCLILMHLTLRVLLVYICTKSGTLQVNIWDWEDIIGNIYYTSKVALRACDYCASQEHQKWHVPEIGLPNHMNCIRKAKKNLRRWKTTFLQLLFRPEFQPSYILQKLLPPVQVVPTQ